MKMKFKRKYKTNPVVKMSAFPNIKKDIGDLLSSEEAKISAQKVLTSAVTLMTFLFIADQQNLLAAHTNNHSNVANSHANNGYHFNSTGSGHVNRPYHGNSRLHSNVGQHMNGAAHASDVNTASTINTHANGSEAVTKGLFHNNASKGAHTAQIGHNNLINTHTNSPTQGHANVNPHSSVNAATNRFPHANTSSLTSALQHGNNGAGGTVNLLFTASVHGSHGSHGQW